MLLLLVFFNSLVVLLCGALLPCDFFHAPFLNNPMAPSHDDPLVHTSWWFNCSKLWCFSCSSLLVVQLLQAMMFLLLLLVCTRCIMHPWPPLRRYLFRTGSNFSSCTVVVNAPRSYWPNVIQKKKDKKISKYVALDFSTHFLFYFLIFFLHFC